MKDRQYFVYILTNPTHTVLYTGVTNNLTRRVYEHKQKLIEGFTKKYNVTALVYYEIYADPLSAITREKTIKNLVRRKKDGLISNFNHEWKDLYEVILE